MRVRLKGIATATKKLADGRQVTYYYAWRGGPRLDGEPGSARFVASYNEAVRSRHTADLERVASLVATFRGSDAYKSLSDKTKRAYNVYLKDIEARFGTMPIAALAEPRVKNVFFNWRDGMTSTPRKADYAWTTLARVFSVAKKRGLITH